MIMGAYKICSVIPFVLELEGLTGTGTAYYHGFPLLSLRKHVEKSGIHGGGSDRMGKDGVIGTVLLDILVFCLVRGGDKRMKSLILPALYSSPILV